MLRKWFPSLTIVALIFAPSAAPAQNGKQTPPTLVVRIKSFGTVVQNAKVIAKLVGKEEVGNQIEALIKAQAGPKGLDGVDTTRPIGLYVKLGEELSSVAGVLMIPIKDQQAFLQLLTNVNYPAAKNDAGVYVVLQNEVPADIGFRFADRYAYITGLNLDALAPDALISPAKMFPKNIDAMVSGSVRVDQIPKVGKDLAMSKIEEGLIKLKAAADREGDTQAQKELAKKAIDTVGEHIVDFLNGGTEVTGQLNIDAKNNEFTAEITIDGRKNSRLKANIAALGEGVSVVSGLINKSADANQQIRLVFPDDIKNAFNEVIDEAMARGLAEEFNPKKKKLAKTLFDAIKPSLHSGTLDSASSIQIHEDGKITAVAGVAVKKGAGLEKAAREIYAALPPREQAKIKLDVDKIGAANVHRLDLQSRYDADAQRIFGDSPVYVAVRNDAIFIAIGKNAPDALKRAVTAKPAPGPVVKYDLKLAPIFKLALKTPRAKAIAQKIFGDDPGTVQVTVEGGDLLRVRVRSSLALLQFGVAVNQRIQEVQFEAGKAVK